MAAARDIDTIELNICIKGLLISRPTVANANVLLRECEDELGKQFPYRQLGFRTFVDYLRSIPNVVLLQPPNSANPDVYPIASKASHHIDQLVSKQRIAPSKRSWSSRRGGYHGRPPPRRRPSSIRSLEPPSRTPPIRSREPPLRTNSVASFNQASSNRDFGSHTRNNYDERDLPRNGMRNGDGLFSHYDGMMEDEDTKVYPRSAGASSNDNHCSVSNGIPAGLEEEYYEYSDEDCYFGEEGESDSEEELSKKTIEIWSQCLKVNVRDTPKQESRLIDTTEENLEQLAHNNDTNVSDAMIRNFQKILSKYPDGIWASQLQQLYFEQFHVHLDFMDLGYTSIIALASSLPNVFTIHRAGSHDWMLYDARHVKPESLVSQENEEDYFVSEYHNNECYIPKTITENIKKLLDIRPNGFRSIDLLDFYKDTFNKPLDLRSLGFKTVEEFLPFLKHDITIKNSIDYYLLLPKLKTVPLEAIQLSKPDEQLRIDEAPTVILAPKGVVRPGEVLPVQELPPLEVDEDDPTKPLLQMDVRVAEVISPSLFYIALDSMHLKLEEMMEDLHKFYSWEEDRYHIPIPHVQVNLICAHKYEDCWHRAKVTGIKSSSLVELEYVDYGTPATVNTSELRYLSIEFADFPVQAFCAKLIGVKPPNGEKSFSTETCQEFLRLVSDKRLVADVYQVMSRGKNNKERMQLEIFLYDVTEPKEIVLNDYLIEKGLATHYYEMFETADVTTSVQESVIQDITMAQASTSVPSTSSTADVTTSVQESDILDITMAQASTSVPSTSSNPPEEKKRTIGPPPGFEAMIPINQGVNSPLTLPNVTSDYSSTATTQASRFWTAEQKQNSISVTHLMFMNPPFLVNGVLPDQNRQYFPPNFSNIPLISSLPQSHQNTVPPITFNTPQHVIVAPPHNYHPQHHHYGPHYYAPASYTTSNHPSLGYLTSNNLPLGCASTNFSSPFPPYNYPTSQGFAFPSVNRLSPNKFAVYHPSPPENVNVKMSAKVPSNVPFAPIPCKSVQPPKHSPSPNSVPAFTPITVPEWPPKTGLPIVCSANNSTTVPTNSISSPVEFFSSPPALFKNPELLSRPCTPLTPASTEVANICKESSARSSPLHPSQTCTSDSPNLKNPPQNLRANSQNKESYHDSAIISYSPLPDINSDHQAEMEVKAMSLLPSGTEIKLKTTPHQNSEEIFLQSSEGTKLSPCHLGSEELHSAVSSPSLELQIPKSPTEEGSSNGYFSASENMDEVKQHLANLVLSEQDLMSSSKYSYENKLSDTILDNWDDIEPDDTPAKAENYSIDFTQPLDLIINTKLESTLNGHICDVAESPEMTLNSQTFPILITPPPINWKDGFDPDAFSISKCGGNVKKEKYHSPVKLNIKKIPVQKIEIQGKSFHLLCVNDEPAVVALEFISQFAPSNLQLDVAIKVLDSKNIPLYVIRKRDNPDILAEFDKITEFCGGLQKKVVVVFDKITVINLSDVPECLKILKSVPSKVLLDDLKQICNEFQSSC